MLFLICGMLLYGTMLDILQWGVQCSCNIFLLTGLRIYTGEYKAQGPTLCPTEGKALRGPRALDLPV